MEFGISLLLLTAQIHGGSGTSVLELFTQLGPMGWFVAGLLILLSLVSWAIILARFVYFRRAAGHSRTFLEVFRQSQRFSEVASQTEKLSTSPLVGLFRAGYVEIDAQVKAYHEEHPEAPRGYRIKSLEALDRSLRRAANLETAILTRGTGFLATTAAASPFIGLFGTVWGIMVAFRDIGITGSTSLVAVAPGIAEALVNTALGLAAAIPALMGYNYFSNRIREFRSQMTDFTLEFLNLSERNFT
jgi:biopolymer transport protein TolQ